ncbi:nicotinate phosphoribosyltransferase [Marispirochaeta aestuarii]|uniref:nicotinate phosphoribosyltransferase n=1 Tax=Marispirochaeta aestuarii TaxID=1963862 RepID=UPI0029C9006C|nr:nicotinate phosphoribosyltransferase [Marispirochaeta aestuarii]
MTISPLFTDLYELTMAQGYLLNHHNPHVVFDMFFRRQPYGGGFAIFAGIDTLLDDLEGLKFSSDDISYLGSLGYFGDEFLEYLSEFRFSGSVLSFREGSLVFPEEPLIRVEAPLIEAQIIESLLLNIVNFQTLIATKAARVLVATEFGSILEFGMRRAQGYNGALMASRAAYIGGASGTSNTLAGRLYNIPVSGTMAHSWVMAFDSEAESFERYSELYPDTSILLIDTFDTLNQGIENAIIIGKKLRKQGKRIGVRLDSGDLSYLSKQVRARLDAAGLRDAFIAVSGDLNEQIAAQLLAEGAPVDVWGVGTQLATGHPDAAVSGVYKLSARYQGRQIIPTMKVSNNPAKMTNPGIKQVFRFYDKDRTPLRDVIQLADEPIPEGPMELHHPTLHYKRTMFSAFHSAEEQLLPVMREGKRLNPQEDLKIIRDRVITQLQRMDETFLRQINPHEYKISLSRALRDLKFRMIDEYNRG